jgi:hypothetical protein
MAFDHTHDGLPCYDKAIACPLDKDRPTKLDMEDPGVRAFMDRMAKIKQEIGANKDEWRRMTWGDVTVDMTAEGPTLGDPNHQRGPDHPDPETLDQLVTRSDQDVVLPLRIIRPNGGGWVLRCGCREEWELIGITPQEFTDALTHAAGCRP